MRRGTAFIFLFVLAAIGVIGASTLLRNQPALEITVAVDPLAQDWVRDAALAFNESGATVGVGRRVRVLVTTRSDTSVLGAPWSPSDNPDGWIPAWSSVAGVSRGTSVTTQQTVSSLARTPLIWMSYDDRTEEIPDVSWQGIVDAVGGPGVRVNLAFSLPSQSAQGLGALISAVADYHQSGILTDANLSNSQMRAWLAPLIESVPNFNTLGPNVAQYVAGAQGGTVDAAIAPESQWLLSLRTLLRPDSAGNPTRTPRFAYPEFPVVFDFPFYTLRDAATTDDQISASQSFAAFLAAADQQAQLERYGLRPAQSDPLPTSAVFSVGQPYGIVASLPAVQPVQLPAGSSLQALLTWFNNTNR